MYAAFLILSLFLPSTSSRDLFLPHLDIASFFISLPPSPLLVAERVQMEHQVRDESPGVPPVAENVEVVTGPPEQELSSRQTAAAGILSFKRAATSWERQGAKNPRLTEGLSVSLSYSSLSFSSVSLFALLHASLRYLLPYSHMHIHTVYTLSFKLQLSHVHT